MTERELQVAVLEVAALTGWLRAHFRPALTARGWRTPVEAEGAGFPDLVLVRERVVWAELKGPRGKLSLEQAAWIQSLRRAGQEVYVWTPEDWTDGTIEATLVRPTGPAALRAFRCEGLPA